MGIHMTNLGAAIFEVQGQHFLVDILHKSYGKFSNSKLQNLKNTTPCLPGIQVWNSHVFPIWNAFSILNISLYLKTYLLYNLVCFFKPLPTHWIEDLTAREMVGYKIPKDSLDYCKTEDYQEFKEFNIVQQGWLDYANLVQNSSSTSSHFPF